MQIEEAIITAIEYEVRIREHYVESQLAAIDPVARRVFGLMAGEENDHVKYLEMKLKEWNEGNKLSAEDLGTALPSLDWIEKEVGKLASGDVKETATAELGALETAAAIESETSQFYAGLVEKLPDEAKSFFSRFVEIESGHLALVNAELDAVKGNGFWFDIPEFDIEAG
jgi:rubrerythrin